jgi:hypothetical protein
VADKTKEGLDTRALGGELNDAALLRNVDDAATELVREGLDGGKVEVLGDKSLGSGDVTAAGRVELGLGNSRRKVDVLAVRGLARLLKGADKRLLALLEVGGEVGLGELWTKDGDLGNKELTLDHRGVGVVQDGPHRDEVLELATGLLNDGVLALEDDAHARKVADLGLADDKRVWGCEHVFEQQR